MTTDYFDSNLGAQLRDEGIAKADSGVTDEWREQADLAFVLVALRNYTFTSDAVWRVLEDVWNIPSPKERRAMGARAKWAASRGTIVYTKEHRPSDRPDAHRNPKTVYRSLIYTGEVHEDRTYEGRVAAVIDEARRLVDMIDETDYGYEETLTLRKRLEALDVTTRS